VSNSGTGDAAGAIVQDVLPDGLDGNGLDWTGTITAGQAVTFTLPVSVTAGWGKQITNTATFSHTFGGNGNAAVMLPTVADVAAPFFNQYAPIMPTGAISDPQPVFLWHPADDTQSGVVSYTLLITGQNNGLSVQESSTTITVTQNSFTPTTRLSNGVYTWTVRAHDTAGNASDYVNPPLTFTLNTKTGDIYLPIIMNGFINGPDLVIDELTAGSGGITVTIRNVGTEPAVDAFWVDVYFNPSQTPAVNKPWQSIAPAGATWGVTKELARDETLTLTVGGDYYFAGESSTTFPAEASVYALVDSVNHNTNYGNVQEGNEGNNLRGPVTSAAEINGAAASPPDQLGQAAGLSERFLTD